MKVLNILLLVSLIISTVFGLIYNSIISIYTYTTLANNYSTLLLIINIFKSLFNITTTTLLKVLASLIVFGILTKKKLPYTIFTIIILVITIVNTLINIITLIPYITYNLNFINLPLTMISLMYSCSFVLFLYSLTQNIDENNNKN